MKYEYRLIWHSQYGKEEIDTFDTQKDAKLMRAEYEIAYGGRVTIKRMNKE